MSGKRTSSSQRESRPETLVGSAPPGGPEAEGVAARFLRAFQLLATSTRLYEHNHPRLQESLAAVETELRATLGVTSPLALKIERGSLVLTSSDCPLSDPRGELRALADELSRRGVATLVFLPETHLGELGTFAALLVGKALRITRRRAAAGGSESWRAPSGSRGAGKGAAVPPPGPFSGDWGKVLSDHGIAGIRVNVPVSEKKADAVLRGLVATVLAPSELIREAAKTMTGTAGVAEAAPAATVSTASSADELMVMLHLLERIAAALAGSEEANAQEAAQTLRAAVAEANPQAVAILGSGMTRQAAHSGEALEPYLGRLAKALVLEFAGEEFRAGRLSAPELRPLLARCARELLVQVSPARPGREARPPVVGSQWTEESYAEHLQDGFWEGLAAESKSQVLAGREAWCVPVNFLRQHLEELAGASPGASGPASAPGRSESRPGQDQARRLLLNYAGCLESQQVSARQATATGLSELQPLIERLWPDPGAPPQELTRGVLRALVREAAPEVAGVLAAVTDNLGGLSLSRASYAEYEWILDALEKGPGPSAGRSKGSGSGSRPMAEAGGVEPAFLKTLAKRLLQDQRWEVLVSAALENRPLDASLPRILVRDPERLLEGLSVRLAAADEGLEALPPMARLLRAIGEPAIGALVTRLFDPRGSRAAAAVKLLAATRPERLLVALPQVLPSWEWNLQDLAVSELVQSGSALHSKNYATAFLEALPHAHPLVVPMIVDQIGLAKELAALPTLIEIAAGQMERLRDVFVRIKAIEALGRMLSRTSRAEPKEAPPKERTQEAGDLLRKILRERTGLTHVEPAGLRAAAEEALGLIENWPSSARVRTAQEALEKASVSHTRPRRYLRIPLESPLAGQINSPQPAAVRVKTISLGGAFLESPQRLRVGESLQMEIKTGLRRIQSTAVVRNVSPQGGGVEFVHMKHDDRERLRQLVARLLSRA